MSPAPWSLCPHRPPRRSRWTGFPCPLSRLSVIVKISHPVAVTPLGWTPREPRFNRKGGTASKAVSGTATQESRRHCAPTRRRTRSRLALLCNSRREASLVPSGHAARGVASGNPVTSGMPVAPSTLAMMPSRPITGKEIALWPTYVVASRCNTVSFPSDMPKCGFLSKPIIHFG